MSETGASSFSLPEKPHKGLLWGAFLFLAFTLIRNSWMSDDAYITMRCIVNLLEGYGPVFNPGERVQAYSHPLWFLFLTPFYAITREAFFTVQFVSLFLSLFAVHRIMTKLLHNGWAAFVFLLLLPFSKAFVDFSSSGLENALSFMLVAFFLTEWFREEGSRFRNLAFIACLAVLNRHDNLIFFLPALLFAFWNQRGLKTFLQGFIAFLPFILWTLFSLFYYGFPFPNTAYAKLNTGIPSNELWLQGFSYLLNSLQFDPLSLFLIFISFMMIATHAQLRKDSLALALGFFLYLVYVMKVGGDFMSGRFISMAFFLAAVLLARTTQRGVSAMLLSPLLLLGLFNSGSPVYLKKPLKDVWENVDKRGIADERAFYETDRSLLYYSREAETKIIESALKASLKEERKAHPDLLFKTAIGVSGYYSGPNTFIVDNAALSEPLLARLPMDYTPIWRIGHFIRAYPEGYRETLRSGVNKIQDPKLHEFYDHLCVLTRAPLFSAGRISEIIRFNTGAYDGLIDRDRYRNGGESWNEEVVLKQIKADGTAWNDPANTFIRPGEYLKRQFHPVQHADSFEVSVDNNDVYRAEFFLEGKKIHEQWISPEGNGGGLKVHLFALPAAIAASGFDRMYLLPVSGDNTYVLGHIRFIGHE